MWVGKWSDGVDGGFWSEVWFYEIKVRCHPDSSPSKKTNTFKINTLPGLEFPWIAVQMYLSDCLCANFAALQGVACEVYGFRCVWKGFFSFLKKTFRGCCGILEGVVRFWGVGFFCF